MVVLAALTVSMGTSSALDSDTDLDGVSDALDIDDDNDGVVDGDEMPTAFVYATDVNVSGATATGTLADAEFTYTSSVTIQTSEGMYAVETFPPQYSVPTYSPTIANVEASANTVTFSAAIRNPVVVLASIGNPDTPVGVEFDRRVEVLWRQGVTIDSQTRITGSEGFAVLRLPGYHTSFSFDYLADENYVNFAFGAEMAVSTWDTDNDTIPDHLDLDSDGDWIVDTMEAKPNTGFVVASGVDSDDNGLDDAYELTPGSGNGLSAVDTDSDGEPDLRDSDADGDGYTDAVERGFYATIDFTADHDHDGIPNMLDASYIGWGDDDGDGVFDWNSPVDNEGDGVRDYRDLDSDNDGAGDATDRNRDVIVSVNDSAETLEGVAVTVDVLANDDVHAGADRSLVDSGTGTATGEVTMDATTGTITYTPAPGELGDVTIDYVACNTAVSPPVCGPGTLTVSIGLDTDHDGDANPTDTDDDNDGALDDDDAHPLAATAADDRASTQPGVAVTVDVLANDDFTPGANLSLVDTGSGTATGTAALDALSGTLTYTPGAEEVGAATVVYRVCNTAVDPEVCDTATATITVNGQTITGQVYRDLDRDGALDESEPDISGVTVRLLRAGPDASFGTADDVVVATTVTASPFVFHDVAPGSYAVAIDQGALPPGLWATDDGDGGSDQLMAVTVSTSSSEGLSLGLNYVKISGVVTGPDGQPIGNARVTLTDSSGTPFEVMTAADGTFELEGSASAPLTPGIATVQAFDANGNSVSLQLEVKAGTSPAEAPLTIAAPTFLPRTGASPERPLLLGVLLLMSGAAATLAARRRAASPRS